ncbi:MAG TPA: hypothetical protein VG435_16670 [Acidimicrobiales bacterium]|jgi:hypothetical protein|nr:hypothetical protein [Acidimicrobiales bacterium]
MNPETVDNEYAMLEHVVQSTAGAIDEFTRKLQRAAQAGDAGASNWLRDLRNIAIQVQQEQMQMQSLLQALHDFTVSSVVEGQQGYGDYQQPGTYGQSGGQEWAQPNYAQPDPYQQGPPQYAQQPQYAQPPQYAQQQQYQGAAPGYIPDPNYQAQPARPEHHMGRFLGGSFRQAIMAGTSFGIADELINRIA